MSQAPTYNDIRANQQAQAQAASAAQAQQVTGQQVQGEVQGNRNELLYDTIDKHRNGNSSIPTDPGLGNINTPQQGGQEAAQYTMIATEVANNSANEMEYTQNMIALAEAGKLSEAAVMSDPVVQQVMKAQQAPAPVPGLGQIQ